MVIEYYGRVKRLKILSAQRIAEFLKVGQDMI